MDKPENPAAMAASLTPPMQDMLLRAVATNGGGLNGFSENRSTWQALYRRDLIQGKRGQPSSIVHTRLGLLVARELEIAERSK